MGLGNPGAAYASTRHNAGFLLADAVAARWALPAFGRGRRAQLTEGGVGGGPVAVVKPQTYMNRSGQALAPYLVDPVFDPARDLLILVDDHALPLGAFRLRAQGSAGGHNGLKSVQGALGTTVYARLRIGIGPVPADAEDSADWLLAPFAAEERRRLDARLPAMVDAVEHWRAEGIEAAMNQYNQLGNQPIGDET